MPTDADIVAWHRAEAAALAERSRGCRVRADSASSRPYQKMMRAEAETSDTFAAHHVRAADAIEANATLAAENAALVAARDAALARARQSEADHDAVAAENARLRALLKEAWNALAYRLDSEDTIPLVERLVEFAGDDDALRDGGGDAA